MKPLDIGAVVVVLLDDEIRRVDVIHPVRHILGVIVLMLSPVTAFTSTAPLMSVPPKSPMVFSDPGADPVGIAVLVDLEGRLVKHIGGVVEAADSDRGCGRSARRWCSVMPCSRRTTSTFWVTMSMMR